MKTPEEIADQTIERMTKEGYGVGFTREIVVVAIEADRKQREESPLIEAVADALADRYGDEEGDTAAWVRDPENEDEAWAQFIGPMLDDIREEH